MKAKLLFLSLFMFFVSGCYTNYTGIYFLYRAELRHSPSLDYNDLVEQLSNVLQPFGFQRVQRSEKYDDLIAFSHNKLHGDRDLMALAGSGGRISVVISSPPYSAITIKDWEHVKETEFMKKLKESIERCLEKHYRPEGIKFKRQLDLLT